MWTEEQYGQVVDALRLVLGRPDPVRFDRLRAAFPGALYISRDDQLELRAYGTIASLTTVARARILTPEGEVVPSRWDFATSSDGTASTSRVGLAEGFLLSLSIEVSGASPMRGEHYATARLFHGNAAQLERVQTLVAGFVTPETVLTWPEARTLAGPDTRRALVRTTVAAPAAGAESVFTVPTARRVRLQSWRATLTTAVAAANRQVRIVIDDGATEVYRFPALDVQVASLSRIYQAAHFGFEAAFRDTFAMLHVPLDVWLRAGWRVSTSTGSIQAADQWSAAELVTEDFLDV